MFVLKCTHSQAFFILVSLLRSDLHCAFRRDGLLGFIKKCTHSKAKFCVFVPYPLGFDVCVSSRRFCMFFKQVCSLSCVSRNIESIVLTLHNIR